MADSIEGLRIILGETETLDIISIIGMPLRIDNGLFNVAVVVQKGVILGIVPKTNVVNYTEEARWFSNSSKLVSDEVEKSGYPVGTIVSQTPMKSENIKQGENFYEKH